jgi:hypothetical protein
MSRRIFLKWLNLIIQFPLYDRQITTTLCVYPEVCFAFDNEVFEFTKLIVLSYCLSKKGFIEVVISVFCCCSFIVTISLIKLFSLVLVVVLYHMIVYQLQ